MFIENETFSKIFNHFESELEEAKINRGHATFSFCFYPYNNDTFRAIFTHCGYESNEFFRVYKRKQFFTTFNYTSLSSIPYKMRHFWLFSSTLFMCIHNETFFIIIFNCATVSLTFTQSETFSYFWDDANKCYVTLRCAIIETHRKLFLTRTTCTF